MEALPILHLEEELRIGSVTDPDIGFVDIGPLDMDEAGWLYVYETRDRAIRVYGPDGRRTNTIGGPGEGPGEFGSMSALGVHGDTVWGTDTRGRLLHLFRPTGELLASNPLERPTVAIGQLNVAVAPAWMRGDGLFMGDMPSTVPTSTVTDTVRFPRLLFDASSAVVDTAGWSALPPRPAAPSMQRPPPIEIGGVRYGVPAAPGSFALTISFADGSALIDRPRATGRDGAEFSVTRHRLDGAVLQAHRFRYRPGEYAGAVLDSILMRDVRIDGEVNRAAYAAVRAAVDFPAFQTPIYTGLAGTDGALWIRREDNAGPFRWIVIGPTGEVRGIVQLARNQRPEWAADDLLWVSETDPFELVWLVRYRISDF